MKKGEKQLIECTCPCHALEVEHVGDEVDVILWETAQPWHKGRIRQAWEILKGRNVTAAEFILTREEAMRLADMLRGEV